MKIRIPPLTLLHSERPKLHTILAFLSAVGLRAISFLEEKTVLSKGANKKA